MFCNQRAFNHSEDLTDNHDVENIQFPFFPLHQWQLDNIRPSGTRLEQSLDHLGPTWDFLQANMGHMGATWISLPVDLGKLWLMWEPTRVINTSYECLATWGNLGSLVAPQLHFFLIVAQLCSPSRRRLSLGSSLVSGGCAAN